LWGYLYPLWYVPFENELKLDRLFYSGLAYFMFIPGIFLIKEIGRTIRILLIYAALYFFIYLVMGRKIIFLFSIIPVLAVVTAYVIVNLYGQKKNFYQVVMVLFFLAIATNFYTVWPWMNMQSKIDMVAGVKGYKEYLNANLDSFGMDDYINTNTKKESVILLLAEKRTFYLDRKVIGNSHFSKSPFVEFAGKYKTAGKVADELKKMGATHIYVNREKVEKLKKYHNYYWNEHVEKIFSILIEGYARLVHEKGEVSLYEL
ncbi:hypothetical protein ACFLTD_03390, partial [Elusimicrobiota bacterium]